MAIVTVAADVGTARDVGGNRYGPANGKLASAKTRTTRETRIRDAEPAAYQRRGPAIPASLLETRGPNT
jgi:hypothetical protein